MSSNPVIKFHGTIQHGNKIYYKPLLFQERMKQLEGKRFVEILEEYDDHVTPDQHGYYRSCIRFLIDNTEIFAGWEEKELHSYFAELGLGYEKTHIVNGKIVHAHVVPSTADISKKQMSKYIDWFVNTVAEYGIILPLPEEVATRKYSTKIKNVKTENSESG